jgi:hypothetical protein
LLPFTATSAIHPSLLAWASTPETTALRLTALDGDAIVHLHGPDGIESYVAGSAEGPLEVDAAQAGRVAERCGQSGPGSVDTITDDQWTVHEQFSAHRPLHRVRLADPAATVLYVSSHTGEVVQRTTRTQRAWSWMGSVPHWIYATAVRRHWALWDALVWWLAVAGSIGVAAGLVLGVVRWRRSPRSRVSPYHGAMYWHHVLGLGVGVLVLAWIVSGGLSMDHGRLFSTGAPSAEQHQLVAGTTQFDGDPRTLGSRLPTSEVVKEVEWLRVAGRPYLRVRHGPDHQRLVEVDAEGPAAALFEAGLFADVGSALVPPAGLREHRVLEAFDTYYYGRAHAPRPLPVLRLRYDDLADTWLHVDLATGKILDQLDEGRRAYRFWFNALHSHDLPWMLDRPGLRRAWIVALCGLGFLFSCNAVLLAWRRLRRA